MTKIYLTLTAKCVRESSATEVEEKKHRTWFSGGGFEVLVSGTLKHSGLSHAQVAHAAMVAVQASGGKVSTLEDVRKNGTSRKSVKAHPKQMKLL